MTILIIFTLILLTAALYANYLDDEAAKRRAYDPRKERKE